MVIRKTPKNVDDYIVLKPPYSTKMQELGICPKYIDNNFLYFVKTEESLKLYQEVVGGTNFD